MKFKPLFMLMGLTLASISAPGRADPQAIPTAPLPGSYDEFEEEEKQSRVNTAYPYTPWRWVGLRSRGTDLCPEVQDWKLEERRYETGDELLHDLGLDRYCVYTAETSSPRFPLPLPPGLEAAHADRMALSITSSGGGPSGSAGQQAAEILDQHFRHQTRGFKEPGALEFQQKRDVPESSVRLVFLDSYREDVWPLARPSDSLHGYTLAHLAHTLVCPEGEPCAATIATRLALRYSDFNPSNPMPPTASDNGHLGLVSDLGDAIVKEVFTWRTAGSPGHLILNLSLGWDGELDDLEAKDVSELEPSSRRVYDALRYASRSGALVIASAGNRRGGPEATRSPLLPAAWEMKRPSWLPAFLGRKRIYAVGGSDWQGLPLPNSRPGGRPRRAAFADHAVTEGSDGAPTAIYTGTSVSAAVASSIAAVVWHLRPDLTPRQVMRIVTRSGERLPVKADAYSWKDFWPLSHLMKAPRVRRLSLCQAVERACVPGGTACRSLKSVPACESFEKKGPADLSVLLFTPSVPVLLSIPDTPVHLPPPCDPGALFWGTVSPTAAPCPVEKYPDRTGRRWVIPQPPNDPCPGCTLVPDPDGNKYRLTPELSSGWDPVLVGDAVLNIDCYDGVHRTERKSYPIPRNHLKNGTSVSIKTNRKLDRCSASLDFQVEEGGSTLSIQSPVYVDP